MPLDGRTNGRTGGRKGSVVVRLLSLAQPASTLKEFFGVGGGGWELEIVGVKHHTRGTKDDAVEMRVWGPLGLKIKTIDSRSIAINQSESIPADQSVR